MMIRDDVLARSLDELERGASLEEILERHPADRQELDGLLRVDRQLQTLPRDISLPLTAKARLRAQILVEARQPTAPPAPYYFSEWWNRLVEEVRGSLGVARWGSALSRSAVAALSVLLGFGLLGGGTVSASMDSAPGDNLYAVKTVVEQTRLALASNPQEKAETYLWIAAARVHELSKLSENGRPEFAERVASEYKRSVDQAQKHASAKARGEADLQKRIDLVQTNMRDVYENAPKAVQNAMALSVVPAASERTPAPGLTTDDPSRQAPAPQRDVVAPDPATTAGQNSGSITLPREKGGPVTEIGDSGKAAPLTPAPIVPASDGQQPTKGTVPAETAPIPNKEGGITAPEVGGDPARKEAPVQPGGLNPGGAPDGGLNRPFDESSEPTPGTGSKNGTIQGMVSAGHKLP